MNRSSGETERCGGSGFIHHEAGPSGWIGEQLFTNPCPGCVDCRCPTCGSDDPAYCECSSRHPWGHTEECCPDPFHCSPDAGEPVERVQPVGADGAMIVMLQAMTDVRDGMWVKGAPTHVLAEFLTAIEKRGWQLKPAPSSPPALPTDDDYGDYGVRNPGWKSVPALPTSTETEEPKRFLSQWGLWDHENDRYDRAKLHAALKALKDTHASSDRDERGQGERCECDTPRNESYCPAHKYRWEYQQDEDHAHAALDKLGAPRSDPPPHDVILSVAGRIHALAPPPSLRSGVEGLRDEMRAKAAMAEREASHHDDLNRINRCDGQANAWNMAADRLDELLGER